MDLFFVEGLVLIYEFYHIFSLTQRKKSSLSKARTRQNESNAGVNMENSTPTQGGPLFCNKDIGSA